MGTLFCSKGYCTISPAIVYIAQYYGSKIIKCLSQWISWYDTGPKKLSTATLRGCSPRLISCPLLGQSEPVVCTPVLRLVTACIMLCCCCALRVCPKQNTTNSRNTVACMRFRAGYNVVQQWQYCCTTALFCCRVFCVLYEG